jgi:hypothetical protein
MQDFAIIVFPDFKDDRIQPLIHPPDCHILLRNIGPPVEPVRPGKQLPGFFKPYATTRIGFQTPALSKVEWKADLM